MLRRVIRDMIVDKVVTGRTSSGCQFMPITIEAGSRIEVAPTRYKNGILWYKVYLNSTFMGYVKDPEVVEECVR